MNQRGAFQFITYLVVVGITIAFISLGVGGYINNASHQAVEDNGMWGLEAFLMENLMLFVIGGIMLSLFAVIYFGGGL